MKLISLKIIMTSFDSNLEEVAEKSIEYRYHTRHMSRNFNKLTDECHSDIF